MNTVDSISDTQLYEEMQAELKAILDWWATNMPDAQNGGFLGRIDGYGQKHPEADKGVILNTRILWSFSEGAQRIADEKYREMANMAYRYLIEHFWDKEYGGMYWMLDFTGKTVQNSKKQIYAQAFAIYGLTAYYQLSGETQALGLALKLFDLIEQHSFDLIHGGYYEAFTKDWLAIEDSRLSEKDANEAKTMNTHLHIMEAYTTLYRCTKDERIGEALRQLIDYTLNKFIHTDPFHLHLFFDEAWNLKSDIISFGHDIECSWLLWEATELFDDENLHHQSRYYAIQLAEAVQKHGIGKEGALFYELENQSHLDKEKHWWPQAEAVVGFWNAWQLSGREDFKKSALKCWAFIKQYLKDKEHGEWHWSIKENQEISHKEDKAGPWKAPYHNSRMCMEVIDRLKNI
jgi:mannobiose 2-epimerase